MDKSTFLPVYSIFVFLMLALGAAAQLTISDVDVSSPDKANEAKPNELVTISFDLENEGDEKIENVKANVYFERSGKKLKDDTGDEIEFEFDDEIDYIRDGKSKTIEFSFNVPFDVEDGQEYTVVVEAEGKNSSNRAQKFTDTDRSESFTILRENHELLFYKLEISPVTISCDRILNVNYDIRNIGERDEDINLTIVNDIFGINVKESFSLESDYDEDNKWEKSNAFDIPSGIAAGTYGLTVNLAYNNGNKQQYNTTQITVQGCSGQQTTSTGTGTTTTGTTSTSATTTSGTQQPVTVQYTQPGAAPYPAITPKKSGETSITTILIAAIVVIVFLLVVLLALMMRKR